MSNYSIFNGIRYTKCYTNEQGYLPSRTQDICPRKLRNDNIFEPLGSFSIRAAVRAPWNNGGGCVGPNNVPKQQLVGLT